MKTTISQLTTFLLCCIAFGCSDNNRSVSVSGTATSIEFSEEYSHSLTDYYGKLNWDGVDSVGVYYTDETKVGNPRIKVREYRGENLSAFLRAFEENFLGESMSANMPNSMKADPEFWTLEVVHVTGKMGIIDVQCFWSPEGDLHLLRIGRSPPSHRFSKGRLKDTFQSFLPRVAKIE